MLQGLLGLLPIFLFYLNFRFHKHENRIVANGEVLSEGLLEKVVSCAHVSCIRVDHGGEYVRFYNSLILLQAIVDFSQSPRRVIEEPAGLRKKNLSLGECRVLFGHIFEQLDRFDEVLGRPGASDFRLGATVDEILLGKFHEEISVEFDVEVEVCCGCFGLLNVQVERCVKQSDGLNFVTFQAPFKLRLKEGVLRALALRLADLQQELELLRRVLVLLLLDPAVDHAIQGQEESFVALGGSLVRLVGSFVLALEAALVAHFRLIGSVLWLQDDRHVEKLECALEHFLLATTESCEDARNVVDQVRVTTLGCPERVL